MSTADHDHFKLLVRIANRLAFRLPNKKDKVKAFKWIGKIKEINDEKFKRTRDHCFQLLLLCLRSNRLVGPFEKIPLPEKHLNQYDWNLQPSDLGNLILRAQYEELGQPTIQFDLSGDHCEYTAYQKIPLFGAQFYYAYSPEPIQKWSNFSIHALPITMTDVCADSTSDPNLLGQVQGRIQDREAVEQSLEKKTEIGKPARHETPQFYSSIENEILRIDVSPSSIQKATFHRDVHKKNEIEPQQVAAMKKGGKTQNNNMVDFDDNLEEEKLAAFGKMPARLRKRLLTKFIPQELKKYSMRDPKIARTPEIFRPMSQNQKYYRKYKLEDFGLPKDEVFRPAAEVFKNLEYKPPKYLRTTVRGIQDSLRKKMEQRIRAVQSATESDKAPPSINDIENSWERSYQQMVERHKKAEKPAISPDLKRKALREQIMAIKARKQPRRLNFDESESELETEPVHFDRIFYQEMPEDSDSVLDILSEREMFTDDMFGSDQIAQALDMHIFQSYLEDSTSSEEILNEDEMHFSDIFAEKQFLDPNELYQQTSSSDNVRTFQRSERSSPLRNEMELNFNEYLDRRLQLFQLERPLSTKKYGPWAEDFKNFVERMEQNRNSEIISVEHPSQHKIMFPPQTQDELSHYEDEEMKIDDMFGSGVMAEPSPIILARAKRDTLRYKTNMKKYQLAVRQRHERLQKEFIDQDLLEPYVYDSLPDHSLRILDMSFEDDTEQLASPLITRPPAKKAPLLESFERQMDESLKYFADTSNFNEKSDGYYYTNRIFNDREFLNRRILQTPADHSIMQDDEMIYDDVFGEMNIASTNAIRFTLADDSNKMQQIEQLLVSEENLEFESFPKYESFVEAEGSSEKAPIEPDHFKFETSSQSFLQNTEMPTDDMFGEDNMMSPKHLQYESPTIHILTRSLRQTKDLAGFRNRIRRSLGHASIENEQPAFANTALQQFIEVRERLLDPILEHNFEEPQQGLLDESFSVDKLQTPLLVPHHFKKVKLWESFERKMISTDSDDNQSRSYLTTNEMEDMFLDELMAKPQPINEIPMPEPKFGRKLIFDLPDDDIEEVSMPELVKSTLSSADDSVQGSIQENYTKIVDFVEGVFPADFTESQTVAPVVNLKKILAEKLEAIKKRFTAAVRETNDQVVLEDYNSRENSFSLPVRNDLLASFEKKIDNTLLEDESDGIFSEAEMDDMFDDQMIAEPLHIREIPMPRDRLNILSISIPTEQELEKESFPSGFEIAQDENSSDIDILHSDEMMIDDIFGAHVITTPRRQRESPRKLREQQVIERRNLIYSRLPTVINESLRREELLKRFDEIDQAAAEEFSKIENLKFKPIKDPFLSFEKTMNAPFEKPKHKSILSDNEMQDDIFNVSQMEDPLPLQEIPFPTPKKKTPPKPVTHSHLYHPSGSYRAASQNLSPFEYVDEISYPSELNNLDSGPSEDYSRVEVRESSNAETENESNELQLENQPPSFMKYKSRLSYPLDLLDPLHFREFPENLGILDESLKTSKNLPEPLIPPSARPDFLQFDDSIGPATYTSGYEPIRFREVAPGYYEPHSSTDKLRYVQQQKKAMAQNFDINYEDIPDESLDKIVPPDSYNTPIESASPRRFQLSQPTTSRRPRISLHMHPIERIQRIIEEQPKYEVIPLRRTQFSPLEFITKLKDSSEHLLEQEEFPSNVPFDLLTDENAWGPLSRALYIPTEEEEREMQRLDKSPAWKSPIQRPVDRIYPQDNIPIGITDIGPGEENFAWLGEVIPFYEQVNLNRTSKKILSRKSKIARTSKGKNE